MNITFSINETKYSCDLDGTTFTLSRHGISQKGDSKGKETLAQLGYFSHLKSAIAKAIKDELGSQPDEITLKEFIERYELANQSVLDQIGEK